ncbi:MAG: PepSY domain-containing protein [Nitrososphaeraceae archaeon]|nr:PepSY domain-containing protein [Nitrososphaeraceae archaeon]
MMKRIFTTSTFLIALLAIGLIGINNNNHNNSIGNAFAQMDPEDSSMMEDMEMDDGMRTMSNQSDGMKMMMNWTGTIDVKSTIGEAFKSKVTVNIIDAINVAQTNVGANSFVKKAELTPAHGYLVYKIMVVDENMKKYKVIVDPGNGQVLMKKEVTWYDDDEEHKMKYGEEKYNKYNHDDDYDQKKMMKMTKDEKY